MRPVLLAAVLCAAAASACPTVSTAALTSPCDCNGASREACRAEPDDASPCYCVCCCRYTDSCRYAEGQAEGEVPDVEFNATGDAAATPLLSEYAPRLRVLGIAGVVAVALTGTLAGLPGKLAVLRVACDGGFDAIPFELHPTGVSIGGDTAGPLVGAVVLNVALCVATALAGVAGAAVVMRVRQVTYDEGLAVVGVPGIVFIPYMLLLPGTTAAAARLLFLSDPSALGVCVGVAGLGVCLAYPWGLWRYVIARVADDAALQGDPRLSVREVPKREVPKRAARPYYGWTRRVYRVLFGSALWISDPPHRHLCERYAAVFTHLQEGAFRIIPIEVVAQAVLSAIAAWQPHSDAACAFRYAGMAMPLGAVCIFIFRVRPHLAAVDNVLAGGVALLSTSASVCLALGAARSAPSAELATALAGVLLTVAAVLCIAGGAVGLCRVLWTFRLGGRAAAAQEEARVAQSEMYDIDAMPLQVKVLSNGTSALLTTPNTPGVLVAPEPEETTHTASELMIEDDAAVSSGEEEVTPAPSKEGGGMRKPFTIPSVDTDGLDASLGDSIRMAAQGPSPRFLRGDTFTGQPSGGSSNLHLSFTIPPTPKSSRGALRTPICPSPRAPRRVKQSPFQPKDTPPVPPAVTPPRHPSAIDPVIASAAFDLLDVSPSPTASGVDSPFAKGSPGSALRPANGSMRRLRRPNMKLSVEVPAGDEGTPGALSAKGSFRQRLQGTPRVGSDELKLSFSALDLPSPSARSSRSTARAQARMQALKALTSPVAETPNAEEDVQLASASGISTEAAQTPATVSSMRGSFLCESPHAPTPKNANAPPSRTPRRVTVIDKSRPESLVRARTMAKGMMVRTGGRINVQ